MATMQEGIASTVITSASHNLEPRTATSEGYQTMSLPLLPLMSLFCRMQLIILLEKLFTQ